MRCGCDGCGDILDVQEARYDNGQESHQAVFLGEGKKDVSHTVNS